MGKETENRAYVNLGLFKEDVIKIQSWLFPMMNDTKSVSEMIVKTVEHFDGMYRHYALYLIGSEIGQATVKEYFGVSHFLNPENV